MDFRVPFVLKFKRTPGSPVFAARPFDVPGMIVKVFVFPLESVAVTVAGPPPLN